MCPSTCKMCPSTCQNDGSRCKKVVWKGKIVKCKIVNVPVDMQNVPVDIPKWRLAMQKSSLERKNSIKCKIVNVPVDMQNAPVDMSKWRLAMQKSSLERKNSKKCKIVNVPVDMQNAPVDMPKWCVPVGMPKNDATAAVDMPETIRGCWSCLSTSSLWRSTRWRKNWSKRPPREETGRILLRSVTALPMVSSWRTKPFPLRSRTPCAENWEMWSTMDVVFENIFRWLVRISGRSEQCPRKPSCSRNQPATIH